MAYNAGVLKSYIIVGQEKSPITRGLAKKLLHKPNHTYPPQKSNGRPLNLRRFRKRTRVTMKKETAYLNL